METVRIELGGGDYALADKDTLHKTTRALQRYFKPFLKADGQPDLALVDDDDVAQIFILNQVIELSFGLVTRETLDNMPAVKYDLLVKELNRLYQPAPLVTVAN